MDHRTSRLALLAAGLTLSAAAVSTPSTAAQASASADSARSSVTTRSPGAGPTSVLTLAQRCIDARHVALVSNSLRRGRVITLAEAHRWCGDRPGRGAWPGGLSVTSARWPAAIG